MNYLYRFTCGHVGRANDSDRKVKASGFIRVAEIRKAPVLPALKKCPDCS